MTVELQHVSKRYGEATAVNDVSFVVKPGSLTTLLGPSGCGKTTTLRLIAGLETASAGRVLIGGRDVTHAPPSERGATMVFQSYALFPHLDVVGNVRYGLENHGVADAEDRARAQLALVGLAGLERRLPSELSGGQQQRVALARALVLEPTVLLFDEPLSNLDAKLRRKMRTEIRDLQQRLGVTAVYVTHDQEEALAVSDQIIVMDRAVVVQQGTPRELYDEPRTLFVAGFMGEANILHGTLRREGPLGVVRLGALELRLPHRDLPEGDVALAVRPYAIALARAGAGLAGRVEHAVYLGSHMEYVVATEIGSLFVIADTHRDSMRAGDEIVASFDTAAGVVLVPPDRAH